MTWLKVSDDFADDCARAGLSDAAFRTHVEGLLWTMRRETDGHVDALDVRRFAESRDADKAIPELVGVGFWRPVDDGYLVVHHMEHQAEAEVIARRRALDAERQRRQRRKKAGLDGEQPKEDAKSRRDSARDNPRDPGLGWSGRDGKQPTTRSEKEGEEEQAGWPAVAEVGREETAWADALYEQN